VDSILERITARRAVLAGRAELLVEQLAEEHPRRGRGGAAAGRAEVVSAAHLA
jgi:hypothetical protein